MKYLLSLVCALFCLINLSAKNSFKDFLTARTLLAYYEFYYKNVEIPDLKPYLEYKDVNLGFNNFKKYALLLSYYFKTKQLDVLKRELEFDIQNGLCIDSIPLGIKQEEKIFTKSCYYKNREIYLKKMNKEVFQRMIQVGNDDQKYRSFSMAEKDWEKQLILDSLNVITLKELEKKYGWAALLESNYDLYNDYDSCRANWAIFTIIGHFRRDDIIYFRNIAIKDALKGNVGWDEVVLLQQYVLSRNPIFLNVTPFEFVSMKPNGQVNIDSAFLELYTLGEVLMKGRKGMIIEIFPTLTMESKFKSEVQKSLLKIQEFLMYYGLEEGAVAINTEPLYPGNRLNKYYFVYRTTKYKGGIMNWFSPYSLLSF